MRAAVLIVVLLILSWEREEGKGRRVREVERRTKAEERAEKNREVRGPGLPKKGGRNAGEALGE